MPMQDQYWPITAPKHLDHEMPADSAITQATCGCLKPYVACPRHEPNNYAEFFARHASGGLFR